jgi:hypothetical protein
MLQQCRQVIVKKRNVSGFQYCLLERAAHSVVCWNEQISPEGMIKHSVQKRGMKVCIVSGGEVLVNR